MFQFWANLASGSSCNLLTLIVPIFPNTYFQLERDVVKTFLHTSATRPHFPSDLFQCKTDRRVSHRIFKCPRAKFMYYDFVASRFDSLLKFDEAEKAMDLITDDWYCCLMNNSVRNRSCRHSIGPE